MSRIGKAPIIIPKGVQVNVLKNNLVVVKGPNHEMQRHIHPDMIIKINDNILTVERPTEQKRHKALHGLSRTLIANMVEGVSQGFTIKQEVVGVGYKINAQGQNLEMTLGYSHDIVLVMPDEVKVTTETVKGKNPTITLQSHDKELLGLMAAKIRSFRKPEPYKGKGIKYTSENIRRKAGKTASAK